MLKKISKYTLNALVIIEALLLGINAVEGIEIPYIVQITGVMSAIEGIISTYLLGIKNKRRIIMAKEKEQEVLEEIKTEFTEEELKEMYGEIPVIPEEIPIKPETHEEAEDELTN